MHTVVPIRVGLKAPPGRLEELAGEHLDFFTDAERAAFTANMRLAMEAWRLDEGITVEVKVPGRVVGRELEVVKAAVYEGCCQVLRQFLSRVGVERSALEAMRARGLLDRRQDDGA